MKLKNTLVALIIGSLLTAGLVFAADAKKDDAHAAKCCAKADKDGKACDHECCAAAAKDGKNCEKCGGAGKIADNKKPEAKK